MIIHRQCPICQSKNIIGDAIDLYRSGPHISRARCRDCGLVFANPMAEQLDLEKYYNYYYEKEIYDSTDYKNLIKSEIDRISAMSPSEIKKVAPYCSIYQHAGKFLDVGCGLGLGLAYARGLDFELYATEYDQGAIDFVQGRFSVKVFKGDLESAAFPDAYFDFVHISHVIEHVIDPKAYFKEINRILKPGGTLAVGTPNMSSLLYRGYKWIKHLSLQVPLVIDGLEHTFIFPKALLAKIGEEAGFEIKLHYTQGLGEKFDNLMRYEMPLKQKLSRLIQNLFHINQWMVGVKK